MPLYPWRKKTIEHIPDFLVVTWTDETAYERFPEFNWVYDKLEISKRFCPSLSIDLTNESPKKFPVIVKPKSKLLENQKVFLAKSQKDIDQLEDKTGYIAQQIIEGEHITGDYIVRDGKIIDKVRFVCRRDANHSFFLYERLPPSNFDLLEIVIKHIGFKFGIINFETVGGIILNIHLTPTIRVYDISNGFTEQLPHFIKTGEWTTVKYTPGYSRIYRRKIDAYPKLIKPLPEYPKGVTSVTLCFDEGKKLSDYYQDDQSFRYMIINGSNLSAIHNFASEVFECLEFKEVQESEKNHQE